MKIIVTTSDNYHHALKIFCFLFQKHESEFKKALDVPQEKDLDVEVVGYKKPEFEMPSYFKFVSLGVQRGPSYFGGDLRTYFEKQDQYFIWLMEDMFIREVHNLMLKICLRFIHPLVGRVNFSGEVQQQLHKIYGSYLGRTIYENLPIALYRLSTQPSVWNRDFLLMYLRAGKTPWQFETQETNDKYLILGLDENNAPIKYNEGVRKYDINKLNLYAIKQEWIDEMKLLGIINDTNSDNK